MSAEMLTCDHEWNVREIVGLKSSLYEIWCENCGATPETLALLLLEQGTLGSFLDTLHFKIVLKASIIERVKKE